MAVTGRQVRETLCAALRRTLHDEPFVPLLPERSIVARVSMHMHALATGLESGAAAWMPPGFQIDVDFDDGRSKRLDNGGLMYLDLVVRDRTVLGANLFAAEFKRSDNNNGIGSDTDRMESITSAHINGFETLGAARFRPGAAWHGRRSNEEAWQDRGAVAPRAVPAQSGYRLGAIVVVCNEGGAQEDHPNGLWWVDVRWFASGLQVAGEVWSGATPCTSLAPTHVDDLTLWP